MAGGGITEEKKEKGLILHVAGPLTTARAEALKESVEQALRDGGPPIIVNLSDSPRVDTPGLMVLLAAHKHAREAGRGFCLAGLTPHMWTILETVRMTRVFDIRSTVEAALGIRRSPRVSAAVALRVKWTTAEGKTVEQQTTTEVLNAHGARIRLHCPVELWTELTLVNLDNQESAQARVVWAGEYTPWEGQRAGIEFLTPRAAFWGGHYSVR